MNTLKTLWPQVLYWACALGAIWAFYMIGKKI